MLGIVANYYCMQFKRKHMIQTQANGEKPHFGPDLGLLNLNLGHQNLFFKNLASPVTTCHGQVSTYKVSEKTNDPILRKFSDKQADGQTD